ncbi:unnamed protein product [Amoebophrya sp. A25]|nr:unnamed protein product [Amoebophrya sp. A25]|eukprot:GSA25T00025304001.1
MPGASARELRELYPSWPLDMCRRNHDGHKKATVRGNAPVKFDVELASYSSAAGVDQDRRVSSSKTLVEERSSGIFRPAISGIFTSVFGSPSNLWDESLSSGNSDSITSSWLSSTLRPPGNKTARRPPSIFTSEELNAISALHSDWFPVRYDRQFYDCLSRGAILSFVARAPACPNSTSPKAMISSKEPSTIFFPASPAHRAEDQKNPSSSSRSTSRIVGLLTVRYDLSTRTDVPIGRGMPERFIYIATLGVDCDYRGCGIAKALVQRMLDVFGKTSSTRKGATSLDEGGFSSKGSGSQTSLASRGDLDREAHTAYQLMARHGISAGPTRPLEGANLCRSREQQKIHARRTPVVEIGADGRRTRPSHAPGQLPLHPVTSSANGKKMAANTRTSCSPGRTTSGSDGDEHDMCSTPFGGVYLHVISFNVQAQRLYESLGFVYYKTMTNFYCLNDTWYDAYAYIYLFDSGARKGIQSWPVVKRFD